MFQILSSLLFVFAIGMLIRWAVKRRKRLHSAGPTAAPPILTAHPSAFCPQCGQPAGTGSVFCGNCGAKLGK